MAWAWRGCALEDASKENTPAGAGGSHPPACNTVQTSKREKGVRLCSSMFTPPMLRK